LPADWVDGIGILDEILWAGCFVRISSDGRPFMFSSAWSAEQTASKDSRWATRCPACKLTETLGNSPEFSKTLGNSPKLSVEGRGGELSGVEWRGTTPFCSKHPTGTDTPCRACGNARRAYDAEQTADKNKPTRTPPRKTDYCPEHDWLLKKDCNLEHEAVAS